LKRSFSLAGKYTHAPDLQIDPRKTYTAIFHTVKGDITVELFAAQAPITVNNFVFLAREGFYNNTTFHRVIAGFMAQGGDPTGTGRGGPGYQFADEPGALAIPHDREGILSMANAGANTNGSQFFITYGPTPHLNGQHGVFGRVTQGINVLRSIRERDPQRDRNPGDAIVAIDIVES
jgi:cyclophilin family peptidyl-prolyl cis-trans isomerase